MDEKLKTDMKVVTDSEAQRRLEMYKRLRKDIKTDDREEKEAAFQKRSDQIEKRDKQKVEELNTDDGDDFLKGLKTFGTNDN